MMHSSIDCCKGGIKQEDVYAKGIKSRMLTSLIISVLFHPNLYFVWILYDFFYVKGARIYGCFVGALY